MNATATQAVMDDNTRAIDRALEAFLQREYPQASEAQCRLAGFVSQQLAGGHLCLPIELETSRRDAEQYCGEPLDRLLADNPLVGADGSTPLVLDGDRLYLLRYWRLERRLAAAIDERLNDTLVDGSAIRDTLVQLFADSGEQPDWQKVACALAGRTRFGIITGGPGTGKTTTVVKLLALLQDRAVADGPPLTIQLAAPTGKAAKRLQTSIGQTIDNLPVDDRLKAMLPAQVKTLHRLLGTQRHSRHFRHDRRNPLIADLVVVDEASMIDIDMMNALLDALPARCRLVLVGDKDQLASVEAGAVMAELCATADAVAYDGRTIAFVETATGEHLPNTDEPGSPLAQQTVRLRKNWRSKDAPGINALAEAINRQDVEAVQQAFDDHPQQLQRTRQGSGWIQRELIEGHHGIDALLQLMRDNKPDGNAGTEQADAWARQLLGQLAGQQLLAPLRRGPDGIDSLNAQIINHLQRSGLIDDPESFPGQPLLVTSNLYDLGLMNGDLGLLLDHPTLGPRVAFEDTEGNIRWILPDQLESHSQTAYALSVHQSQGSEFKRVLLHLPGAHVSEHAVGILTTELVYTAVTRASREFVLVEDSCPIFEQAIRTETRRYSGLGLRLHGR